MNIEARESILKEHGWVKHDFGTYRSSGENKKIEGFEVYVRETKFEDFLEKHGKDLGLKIIQKDDENDDFLKKSSSGGCKTPEKIKVSHMGSKTPMGKHNEHLTPQGSATNHLHPQGASTNPSDRNSSNLPELSDFAKYPSLQMARPDKPCLLVAYDSEWQTLDDGREMLSYQFAFIWNEILYEVVILRTSILHLDIYYTLGFILDFLNFKSVDVRKIRKYEYCTGWDECNKPITVVTDDVKEAKKNAVYVYKKDRFTHEKIADREDKVIEYGKEDNRDWYWWRSFLDFEDEDAIKVTLLCHTGKVDVTGMDTFKGRPLLDELTEVQGGLVSLQPIRISPKSLKATTNKRLYPVSLSLSDTMCHAPAGFKSLDALGTNVGVHKLDIDKELKRKMALLLEQDPVLFFEYASTDSVVTLMYASSLYGYNNTPPVTITSATAKVMKKYMMEYLGVSTTADFDYVYRGLEKVEKGMVERRKGLGYTVASSLDPISNIVQNVQYFCSQAYHGGYNICTEVGYFPFMTYDYDIKNAYPTAMCLVPDIDWNITAKREIHKQNLTLDNFEKPFAPFVGYIHFEFPEDVKYPCIPVHVGGVPVYPKTSEGLAGVYVAGPYIYLALKLGAKIWCDTGYFLQPLYTKDGDESRSLSYAVRQLIIDRDNAKKYYGKKSLPELILKIMVNSGYGKNAQNVIDKTTWSARTKEMEEMGCSSITNPFSAMMTTAIVQVTLIAAQNQIYELKYMVCSVTTDGFISNIPEDILNSLDLYGIKFYLEEARIFLTGKPDIWEIKHYQDDLVNFTTRGNVSLHDHGVCAHNSAKSGFENDSYEDRHWLMTSVLGRKGPVTCYEEEWTSFKELVYGKPFVTTIEKRDIHQDFDMKRKPDRNSFYTDKPVIDGIEYEIAHFNTVPFENIDEFLLYRKKKELMQVIRTEDDFEKFFLKVDLDEKGSKCKVRDLDWSILNSCIMGYRAGFWDIPALNTKTEKEKIEWIQSHNTSKIFEFKKSHWKNTRRPERQLNMLPEEFLWEKLKELQNDFQPMLPEELEMIKTEQYEIVDDVYEMNF